MGSPDTNLGTALRTDENELKKDIEFVDNIDGPEGQELGKEGDSQDSLDTEVEKRLLSAYEEIFTLESQHRRESFFISVANDLSVIFQS